MGLFPAKARIWINVSRTHSLASLGVGGAPPHIIIVLMVLMG
jgi:hypothetical protein